MDDRELRQIQPSKYLPKGYFWGAKCESCQSQEHSTGPYTIERELFPDASLEHWKTIVSLALDNIREAFDATSGPVVDTTLSVRALVLSDELELWRREQHSMGRRLPPKGHGLQRVPEAIVQLLGAQKWPSPLLTRAALNGVGYTNLLIGAYDAPTLYSNYCIDMWFYHEHGYHKAFPDFGSILEVAFTDPESRNTLGGTEHRDTANVGRRYIQQKSLTEERCKVHLGRKSAILDRQALLMISLCESSLFGMAAEAMARGFDPGAIVHEFAFSAPGTDVIDVGSDHYGSELFNSFLNTNDITCSGVISESALRNVYDAFAHIGARTFTENWSHPGSIVCSGLYSWHILNDRHNFLRRAVLGSSKMRKQSLGQRFSEWDEAFDKNGKTTGFSRPLANPCDGKMICDQVKAFLGRLDNLPLLENLWYFLSIGPVEYVSKMSVDQAKETSLINGLELALFTAYAHGLAEETTWMLAHASHHAWQINYLFEAAMFGSLLDDGSLEGKLDRFD